MLPLKKQEKIKIVKCDDKVSSKQCVYYLSLRFIGDGEGIFVFQEVSRRVKS